MVVSVTLFFCYAGHSYGKTLRELFELRQGQRTHAVGPADYVGMTLEERSEIGV